VAEASAAVEGLVVVAAAAAMALEEGVTAVAVAHAVDQDTVKIRTSPDPDSRFLYASSLWWISVKSQAQARLNSPVRHWLSLVCFFWDMYYMGDTEAEWQQRLLEPASSEYCGL
jgi:hypothetical protein